MAEDPTVCFLCCDAPPSIHSNPPCEHRWCTSCLGEYIDLAIKSETYYPIKMCPEEESLDISVIAENCDELQGAAENLLAKMKEYNTPPAERRYTNCCQAFIPKKNPRVYYTQCEGCWEVVCAKCGDEYHGKTACKSTEESEAQLVIEETTHRCPNPKCNVPIEKNRGCNHIFCTMCKHQFCWLCSRPYKPDGEPDCTCDPFEGVEEEDEGAMMINRPARVLDAHRNWCTPGRNVIGRAGGVCELCEQYLPVFLFRCPECNMSVCRGCRYAHNI